ncbi:neprilysin-4-like [Musca vetustissima]|uniref:neprilysin-4-like n=1 Tax=Musca vetustissima TaxID=27455 RepID=UPI002AB5E278|nr:neprilysin-4-like [Musca vetustissima]
METKIIHTIVSWWAILFSMLGAQGSPFNVSEKSIRSEKSEEIQKYINESVDPCTNFYEFACGNWKTLNRADETEPRTSFFLNVDKEFENKLKGILENNKEEDLNENEKKVQQFYKSCLQREREQAEESYRNQLKEIINEFGKMPVLEGGEWNQDEFNWLETISNISYKYGINIIFGYEIIRNPKNVSINTLVLQHQKFEFPLALYGTDALENLWRKYHTKVSENLKKYFNFDQNLADVTATEILDFEAQLAKGGANNRYGPDEYWSETTINKLHRKYMPDLDMKQYFQMAFGSIPEEVIIERNEAYQYNLVEVIKRVPKRIIANYIFYNLVNHFGGKDSDCIGVTRKHFRNLVENMWYRRNDLEEIEKSVYNMFEDLLSVFNRTLISKKFKWVNPRVRRYTIEKLNVLAINIYNYENVNFTQEYGELKINPTDYIENLKNIYTIQSRKNCEKFNQLSSPYYDPTNMPLGPKYIRQENRILIPLAVLQPHLFRSTIYPLAVNFGQLGFHMAHAIVHAFDDESRYADKYGNEVDWWDHRSKVFFNDRTECFRQQYQRYTYADHPWPDSVVQSENIADNGGIRLAYQSYKTWYEYTFRPQNNLDQEQLPDLKYKNKKLFFISYAQTLCADIHPDYAAIVLDAEYNPPEGLRVRGALSNLEEFSQVFRCPRDSPMNPEDKCKLY